MSEFRRMDISCFAEVSLTTVACALPRCVNAVHRCFKRCSVVSSMQCRCSAPMQCFSASVQCVSSSVQCVCITRMRVHRHNMASAWRLQLDRLDHRIACPAPLHCLSRTTALPPCTCASPLHRCCKCIAWTSACTGPSPWQGHRLHLCTATASLGRGATT